MKAKEKRQRQRLFDEQGGKCYWCGCEMVLPVLHVRYQPRNLATVDHLDDRFNPDRGNRCGELRHVVACKECNERRGRQSELAQDAREIRRRSGRGLNKNDTPSAPETSTTSAA